MSSADAAATTATVDAERGDSSTTAAAESGDSSSTVVAISDDSSSADAPGTLPAAASLPAEATMAPHGDPATRRRRGHKRCPRCLKVVRADWYRLHRVAHVIQGSEGINLPPENRCARCTQADRRCRVAVQPRTLDTPTLRCACCLLARQECSLSSSQNWERVDGELAIHPAI